MGETRLMLRRIIRKPLADWWMHAGVWWAVPLMGLTALDAWMHPINIYVHPAQYNDALLPAVVNFLSHASFVLVLMVTGTMVCRLISRFYQQEGLIEPEGIRHLKFILAVEQMLLPTAAVVAVRIALNLNIGILLNSIVLAFSVTGTFMLMAVWSFGLWLLTLRRAWLAWSVPIALLVHYFVVMTLFRGQVLWHINEFTLEQRPAGWLLSFLVTAALFIGLRQRITFMAYTGYAVLQIAVLQPVVLSLTGIVYRVPFLGLDFYRIPAMFIQCPFACLPYNYVKYGSFSSTIDYSRYCLSNIIGWPLWIAMVVAVLYFLVLRTWGKEDRESRGVQ